MRRVGIDVVSVVSFMLINAVMNSLQYSKLIKPSGILQETGKLRNRCGAVPRPIS
jgi:hypothetical protein